MRQRARKREAAGETLVTRWAHASTLMDPEAMLLVSVLRRSLMTAETDARRLRRKNAKALRLAIELSKREANKEAVVKAKATCHAKEHDRLLHRLSGIRCGSDSDPTHGCTSSSDDGASPHPNAYKEEGHSRVDDRNGEGPARKW